MIQVDNKSFRCAHCDWRPNQAGDQLMAEIEVRNHILLHQTVPPAAVPAPEPPPEGQTGSAIEMDYQADVDLLLAWIGQPEPARNVEVEPGVYVRVSPAGNRVVGIEILDCASRFQVEPSAVNPAFVEQKLRDFGACALAQVPGRRPLQAKPPENHRPTDAVILNRYRVVIGDVVRQFLELDRGLRGGLDDTSVFSDLADVLRFAACFAEGHRWESLPPAIQARHRVFDSRRCTRCGNLFSNTDAIAADEQDLTEKVAALVAVPEPERLLAALRAVRPEAG